MRLEKGVPFLLTMLLVACGGEKRDEKVPPGNTATTAVSAVRTQVAENKNNRDCPTDTVKRSFIYKDGTQFDLSKEPRFVSVEEAVAILNNGGLPDIPAGYTLDPEVVLDNSVNGSSSLYFVWENGQQEAISFTATTNNPFAPLDLNSCGVGAIMLRNGVEAFTIVSPRGDEIAWLDKASNTFYEVVSSELSLSIVIANGYLNRLPGK